MHTYGRDGKPTAPTPRRLSGASKEIRKLGSKNSFQPKTLHLNWGLFDLVVNRVWLGRGACIVAGPHQDVQWRMALLGTVAPLDLKVVPVFPRVFNLQCSVGSGLGLTHSSPGLYILNLGPS